MDCSPPGSSVHGILQARILEWVAMSSSRGSSWPRDWTQVSCIAGRFLLSVSPGKYLPLIAGFLLPLQGHRQHHNHSCVYLHIMLDFSHLFIKGDSQSFDSQSEGGRGFYPIIPVFAKKSGMGSDPPRISQLESSIARETQVSWVRFLTSCLVAMFLAWVTCINKWGLETEIISVPIVDLSYPMRGVFHGPPIASPLGIEKASLDFSSLALICKGCCP